MADIYARAGGTLAQCGLVLVGCATVMLADRGYVSM